MFVDSLMPISADIDPENPYKKSLSKRSVLEDSQVKIKAKEKEASAEKRNPYKKL